ncbi:MAG: TIGR00730 family Rossman fold protein [Bdellovibrionaceae bacterium]|nr:TIGR00730 family Rossman fold protein [Bdellovibrionales bacterium]MCB9253908.1 TIGR00730 family Rossman fold protein [Pseudobdellovibrionaceae bacterium]
MKEQEEFKELELWVEKIAEGQHPTRISLLQQIFKTALKLAKESPGTLNLKIATTVIKELRYSFKMFYPWRYTPKITMFGSARSVPGDPVYNLGKAFGEEAVRRNYMIVTGGGPGVMAAGNEGATSKGSFGLNIRLPFEQSANSFIDEKKKLIHYKYFFTRKLFLIKESAAFTMFPGGFGTFDETFELLTLIQTGKTPLIPVIFLEPKGYGFWEDMFKFLNDVVLKRGFISEADQHLYTVVHSEVEAMDHIEHFYKSYHSMRLVGEDLVLRFKKPVSEETLAGLMKNFGSLSTSGEMKLSAPLPAEHNEPELADMYRVVFPFERKDFSTLRLLIDFVNDHTV